MGTSYAAPQEKATLWEEIFLKLGVAILRHPCHTIYMQSNTTTGTSRTAGNMTEWGAKNRKAEAKTKRSNTRRAAINEAKENA